VSVSRDRLLLAGVVFAVLFAQVLLYPGIDRLVAALGADTALNASMSFLAVEFVGFILFAGVWGAASDATGARARFVSLGALLGAVGYVALAAVPKVVDVSFAVVLALRFLQGAATIGAFSLGMTMLMDLDGGHGKNMGAAGVAIGLGTALGAPVGGQLSEIGPVVPLLVAAGLLLCVGVLSRYLTDNAPTTERGRMARIVAGARERPALLVPYAFGFIDRLTAGFFALVGTLYFRTVFELSPGATGLVLALFFAPFAVLQYPMGILSDRVGRTLPVLLGSATYGLGVIAVGLAPTLPLAALAMVLVGVLGALMAPATMALVSDLAVPGQRGVAMAGFNVFGSIGFLAGILGGGLVAGASGFPAAFLFAGGLEILLALLTLPVFLHLDIDGARVFAR
jgi:MFS family permease